MIINLETHAIFNDDEIDDAGCIRPARAIRNRQHAIAAHSRKPLGILLFVRARNVQNVTAGFLINGCKAFYGDRPVVDPLPFDNLLKCIAKGIIADNAQIGVALGRFKGGRRPGDEAAEFIDICSLHRVFGRLASP